MIYIPYPYYILKSVIMLRPFISEEGPTLQAAMRGTLVLSIALALVCCARSVSGPDPPGNAYLYKAFSDEGSHLLSGVLEISISKSGSISGSWIINWADGADRSEDVGPQVGHGTLSGVRIEGELDSDLFINLNPDWADNNVFLHGHQSVTSVSGSWSWTGFAGPLASGRFLLKTFPD